MTTARILGAAALAMMSLVSGQALAGSLPYGSCEPYSPAYNTPECAKDKPYVTQRTTCAGFQVNLTYPSPTSIPAGVRLAPAVLLHGGGTAAAFDDWHLTQGAGMSHPVNPYQRITDHLALQGMLVMTVIHPNSTQTNQSLVAEEIAKTLTCMAARFEVPKTGGTCPGGCINDLLDKVAWNANNKENLIVVGHSSGGVQALFLPQYYGSAVKGMILIDPAKDLGTQAPPSAISSNTPVVHFYPDWYGPLAKNEPNNIMNLITAATLTGPYVPIGIRDYPCSAQTGCGCNPNQGCHMAHHCNGLGDNPSWMYSNNGYSSPTGHASYCEPNSRWCNAPGYPEHGTTCYANTWCGAWGVGVPQNPNCVLCSKTHTGCNAEFDTCSQLDVCLTGATKPSSTSVVWTNNPGYSSSIIGGEVSSARMLERYVVAYAACLGGTNGSKMQPWVNGRARYHDDFGSGSSCTMNGIPGNATCDTKATQVDCEAAGCFWARNADGGPIIRVNNGEYVNAYGPGITGDTRYYGAASTSVAWNYNATNGSFYERTERLGYTPGSAYFIGCQSGPGYNP